MKQFVPCTLALFALASSASAQVGGVSFTFEANVPDQVDINTGDSLGNESFLDLGGFELIPYARSARGGFDDIVASASLTAELTPSGFTGNGINSASDQNFTPTSANSRTTIAFSVSGSLAYEFSSTGFFDNDGGSFSAVLTGPGGVVFESAAFFPGMSEDFFSGVLTEGDYTLVTFAQSRGSIGYSFSIVPAPSGLVLIGLAGFGLTSRRRTLEVCRASTGSLL